MKKRLVLIDGYGFLFRAYFAIKNLKKSDDTATNGAYGFTRMLMNLLANINATHIAIVFDSGKKTFRHEIFPQYKANRPPVPEDLIPQFTMIRDAANALNIKTLEKVGYEADDIIATLATKAEKEDFEVLIVSSDKDLMQLVDDNIFMYDAMKEKKIHIEDVIEKWGVEPSKLLDVLSLIGDTADNVSGVQGIGPKTAVELINEYGSVENLIENVQNIKQEKRKNTIINHLDDLKLSKRLITLEKNVDLEEKLDDLKIQAIEPEKLIKFLNSMEFYTIADKVREAYRGQDEDLFNDKKSNFFEYKKITNQKQLDECIKNIKSKLYIDIITEKYENYDNIRSITIIDNTKKYICFIPFENNIENDLFSSNTEGFFGIDNVFNSFKEILKNENILKISYNIKKLIRISKQYNIEINNYDDIGVMSYVLDSGKFDISQNELIKQFLYDNIELKIKNLEKNNELLVNYEKNKEISKITSDLFNISCFKLETIFFLYDIMKDRIDCCKQKDIYYKIENPLIKVLAEMEFNGIKIDVNELNSLSSYFLKKINDTEESIFKEVGCIFNIGSPKQLGEILFEKLNLPHKKTKTGSYSTDNEILEELSEQGFQIADKIIEWRHFSKLKSTYSDILVKLIDKNYRIHTTFLNTNVVTGRLSSINPNIQNIPIKTEEGTKIRRTFIAKDGYKLIGADYSQIELRILAHYANVKKLIESFNNNEDIHTETAKKVFGVEEITPDMRRNAKIINFSIVYGTTSFGLSKRLNNNKKEAENYMSNYFKLYPEIKQYMKNTIDFASKNGYTETLFGRKCYIDLANSKNIRKQFLERLAINSPIQGTGADIIKMATVELQKKLKDFDAKILLQIHDELVIEVKEEIANNVAKIVKDTMENITKLSVPLIAEAKIGNNWDEIH